MTVIAAAASPIYGRPPMHHPVRARCKSLASSLSMVGNVFRPPTLADP
jgi:hypothetical protein